VGNKENTATLSTNIIIAMLGILVLIAVGYVLAIAKAILFQIINSSSKDE
jgi:hypothetical protein